MSDLDQRVRGLLQSNPAIAMVINADAEAAHRHVVAVLDALRLAGVSRMAIAVTPTSEAR
jgi:biopolymer transport protein ExbD